MRRQERTAEGRQAEDEKAGAEYPAAPTQRRRFFTIRLCQHTGMEYSRHALRYAVCFRVDMLLEPGKGTGKEVGRVFL